MIVEGGGFNVVTYEETYWMPAAGAGQDEILVIVGRRGR